MAGPRAQLDFQWADGAGSFSNDLVNASATDADGNVYVAGNFVNEFTFDNTVNTLETASGFGSTVGAFVVKFDSTGTVLWQRSLGNDGNQSFVSSTAKGEGLAVTPNGDVVVVGTYRNDVFENGQSTAAFNSTNRQMFVWRINSDGTTNWIKATAAGDNMMNNTTITPQGVDFGNNNDIYVAGHIDGNNGDDYNFDLDDSTNAAADVNSVGGDRGFVVRYTSSGAFGNVTSIAGGQFSTAYARGIDYTPANGGQVAIIGETDAAAIFNLTFTNVSNDAFVLIYDDTLGIDKGVAIDNGNGSGFAEGKAVKFDDNSGELWAVGRTRGGAVTTYGSVSGPNYTSTSLHPFAVRIDTAGDVQQVLQIEVTDGGGFNDVDVNTDGDAYVAGYASGTIDMGNSFTHTSTGGDDAIMMIVDTAGTTLFGAGYGSSADDGGRTISVDDFDNVTLAGSYQSGFGFAGGIPLSHEGSNDVFVSYFSPAGCAAPTITNQPINSAALTAGLDLSLSVTASGSGLEYQWFKDGVALTNGGNVSGANAASLEVANVTTGMPEIIPSRCREL